MNSIGAGSLSLAGIGDTPFSFGVNALRGLGPCLAKPRLDIGEPYATLCAASADSELAILDGLRNAVRRDAESRGDAGGRQREEHNWIFRRAGHASTFP